MLPTGISPLPSSLHDECPQTLASRDDFETFLDMVRSTPARPYDLEGDPDGEVFWRSIAANIAKEVPLKISRPTTVNADSVASVVEQIIEQFRFLIEDRRHSEDLYHDGSPRPEKAAQRLFFAVAHSYCAANNLDITPEPDTGNGPVDFKVSSGFLGRVLVEIKLSTNSKVVDGYTKQLATYLTAEETIVGYYIVIDVGGMGGKDSRLLRVKNEAAQNGRRVPPIVFIDGTRRRSASKL